MVTSKTKASMTKQIVFWRNSAEPNTGAHSLIDKKKFGPWAIVTGASSGIGKEFAKQLASSGLNVVLVARRSSLLEELGNRLVQEFGIEYRVV
jgi:hypothetical protein